MSSKIESKIDLKSHIFVSYKIYQELKKYNLNKGIKQFKIEELDQGVMSFDEDQKWIDPRRFEIENIFPSYVLLPRFIWLENIDKLENFKILMEKGSDFDLLTYEDFIKFDEEAINESKKRFNEGALKQVLLKLEKALE